MWQRLVTSVSSPTAPSINCATCCRPRSLLPLLLTCPHRARRAPGSGLDRGTARASSVAPSAISSPQALPYPPLHPLQLAKHPIHSRELQIAKATKSPFSAVVALRRPNASVVQLRISWRPLVPLITRVLSTNPIRFDLHRNPLIGSFPHCGRKLPFLPRLRQR